jgi:flagellar secretion chaperone FliS
MSPTTHDQYLETEVLSANPLQLTVMLYRAAIDSIAAARRHLKSGEIWERSRRINKASEIISELALSLDHEAGGEISRTLAELYGYMQTRLIESNFRQAEPPLAEVESLLSTLLEAWRGAAPAAPPAAMESEYVPLNCTC